MTVEEMKLAFARNLKELMDSSNCNQEDIAKICGVSQQTVSDWLTGKKYPRMDKVQAILDHFNVPMTALVNDGKVPSYYLDPKTAEMAQAIYDNPDLGFLFDAAKDASPEDLRMATEILQKFKHPKE